MKFKGKVKTRTQEKKILILVVCCILFYLAYHTKQYLYLPIVIIMMLAIFHETEHIVDEKGVTISRKLLGLKSVSLWPWEEITAIQPDYIKYKPDCQLLFERNSTLRPFILKPYECEQIIAFAVEKNPDIYVEYATEDEQREIEKKNDAYRKEKAKEQRAAQAKQKAERKQIIQDFKDKF